MSDLPRPIEDAGYARHFEIARDEVFVAGEVERLPAARPTAEAIREHAVTRARAVDEPAALVLYEVGVERSDVTRRILTDRVVARLAKDADPAAIAQAVQAVAVETPAHARGYAVFRALDALGDAFDLADRLRAHPDVLSADPELRRLRFKRYVPNDPLFNEQWHLRNTGQGGGTVGIDIRVTNVWAQGIFGSGIIIGIVDDGVQHTHPDLSPNYVAAYSRNWNGSPGGLYDPAPTTGGTYPDDHGTPCAGLTSARGNNSEGVSGIAPLSGFSGLRLIAGSVGDSQEAEAMAYSNGHLFVKSNSWGPSDNGQTMEAPGSLTRAALSNSTVTGRGGRGTLHVWAGGNGLDNNDNANNDGYANSIYTISIAAVNNYGQQAWYSEPGACHIVTGPSNGGSLGIYSTSLMGQGDVPGNNNYTRSFGGTSASCPIAAGVVALMIGANPNLGWRDVQEILITTARHINPGDTGWRTNSANFTFNHKFGSGLIDANAAVAAAQSWVNLGPQVIVSSNKTSLGLSIPDNNATGVSTTFNISTNVRVEQVTITLGISHARRGHLEIFVTSPSGMESQLAAVRTDNNSHPTSWTYMTVRNWGETSQGTWTVRVADRVSGTSGTLNSAQLVFFGSDATVIEDQPPVLQPIGNRNAPVNQPVSFMVTANDLVDNDVVTLVASNLPPWATFATVSAAGTVNQTFSGTPTVTGTWTTVFHASDKDGFANEPVVINIYDPATTPDYLVDFEGDGETKTAYASGNVTLSGISWNLTNALIGTAADDRKNGARAARITQTGSLTMLANKTNGVGTLTLLHARYGTDANSSAQIEYSTNSGSTWTPAGGAFTATSTTLTQHSVAINQGGNVRIRIVKTAGGSARMNIDDIAMTPYYVVLSDEPPALQAIGNKSGVTNQLMQFTVTATDLIDHDVVTLIASNLPPWATFATVSAASTVNQTFSGTPTQPGTWVTTFHAHDKDGFVNETVIITAHVSATTNFVSVIDATFSGGLPPGWSVTTNGHASAYWRFDNPAGRNNYVGGDSPFAIADSDHAGAVNMDTSLRTRTMNLLTLSEVFVEFNSDFYIYAQATGDVDVSVNGLNGPWINVWRRTVDEFGSLEIVDISAHASGQTNVAVRFRYYNANFDWWWQVDNVKVYGNEIDSDGDGIPDAWEQHYFGDLTTANATSDFSDNGFSDYHAYLAGTNPTDPTAALRIEERVLEVNGIPTVRWQSVADRAYNVLRSTNLPVFVPIASDIPASPPLNTYTDNSATNAGPYYYRIELEQ